MLGSRKTDELDIDKSHSAMRSAQVVAEEAAKADRFAAEKKLEEMTAEELMMMGITRNEQSNYLEAQKYLNAAVTKTKQLFQSAKLAKDAANCILAKCLYGLANGERELGNTARALELFDESLALELSRTAPNLNTQYELYRNMGITRLITEEYLKAVELFSSAVAVGKQMQDQNRTTAVKSYLGLAMVLSGEATMYEGLRILNEARDEYPLAGREDSMDWASHRYHMGRALEAMCRMMGVAGEKYIKANTEYAEAVRLRTQITANKKQINSRYHHSRLADPEEGLYRVSLAMGFKAEAKLHLSAAIEHFKALGNKVQKVAELEACLVNLTAELQGKRRGKFQIHAEDLNHRVLSDGSQIIIKPN